MPTAYTPNTKSSAAIDALYGSPASPGALGSSYAPARSPSDIYGVLPKGYGLLPWGQITEPKIYVPNGGTYYVSNSTANGMTVGNDTTGTGSFAAPWLTIAKALATIPITGNVMVYVNSGTYVENDSGRLILSRTYGDWVSVQPRPDALGEVIITTGAQTSGVLNVRSASMAKLQFRNVTVQSAADSCPCFYHNPSTNAVVARGLHFVGVTFIGRTQAASVNYLIFLGGSADGLIDDLAFIDCIFTTVVGGGANAAYLFRATPFADSGTNQPFRNVAFWRCRRPQAAGTFAGFASHATGIQNLTVSESEFVFPTYGFLIGDDVSGVSYAPCTGVTLSRSRFSATGSTGHGVLIGNSVQNAIMEFCDIDGSQHGVVVKGAVGTVVRRSRFRVTGVNALTGLYNKAGQDTQFLGNWVYVQSAAGAPVALREGYDSTSTAKAGGVTAQGNILIADGPNASLVYYETSGNTIAPSRADYNTYATANGATWGTFRGTTVTSLPTLQGAWSVSPYVGDLATSEVNSYDNTAGGRNDVSATLTTGETYYCRYVFQDGRNFNGLALEPYDSRQHAREAFPLRESPAGTFARPNPRNLPSGRYTVLIQRQDGPTPAASDPLVSQGALAYAS